MERDRRYHQGTVWPWLIGPFVEAWIAACTATISIAPWPASGFSRRSTRIWTTRGLDHISEVADGDAPHKPGGTPFQAWSLGELLRIEKLIGG